MNRTDLDFLSFRFPSTRFVKTNSIPKQIGHICSEVWEVVKAACRGDWHQCIRECFDVIHSTETLIRILMERKGYTIQMVCGIRSGIEVKNSRRGYYRG